MVVPLRVLAVGEEALRNHEVQIVSGTRHRDIEEAPLLLDLGRGAGTEVRGNTAIDDVQDEDRFPFLALGRVNGGKDQIILVEQRHPGLVAGRVRWIERELGQKPFSRGIPTRDLFELDAVEPKLATLTLSSSVLATELGVTESYIQKIRSGVIPHARHFQKLAEHAGVSADPLNIADEARR
jgi:hypothetical protein